MTEKTKSDLSDLIKLKKENPNNPNIAYLNINSLREKIIRLQEICLKGFIYILCVDETKLDNSYPNAQFHIDGYQFPPFRRDKDKHGRRKMVFLWNGIISKRIESIEEKESETIYVDVTLEISKKKWCITFASRPQRNNNRVMFFSELNFFKSMRQ